MHGASRNYRYVWDLLVQPKTIQAKFSNNNRKRRRKGNPASNVAMDIKNRIMDAYAFVHNHNRGALGRTPMPSAAA